MSLSQSTLIYRVKALIGDDTEWEGYLTAQSLSNDLTIDVNDGTDWSEGDIMEFSDGELALVQSIATNAVTVKRAHMGTTAATQASGSAIRKNPVFYLKDVKDAINLTIQTLWPYAWKAVDDTITPGSAYWYDVAATAIDIITVSQLYGTSDSLVGLYGADHYTQRPIVWSTNLPTTLAASGRGLGFPGGFFHSSNTVYVRYRAKLTADLSGSDYTDLSDGLLAEVVAHGAASRLIMAKEAPRITQDDISANDSNVPPQARITAANYLASKFRELRNQYKDELERTIPSAGSV